MSEKHLLFYSPFHDFVHKVLVVAHEGRLFDTIECVPSFPFRNLNGEWVTGQYDLTALNPLGKVPTLVTKDGDVLYQSQTIVEYLDSQSRAGQLYPERGRARYDALRRLSLGDALFEFAVQLSMEQWRPESERRADLHSWLWPKITRSLDVLEMECSGWASFDIGHAGLLQGVSYLDAWAYENDELLENPCINWRSAWPVVSAWFGSTLNRPPFKVIIRSFMKVICQRHFTRRKYSKHWHGKKTLRGRHDRLLLLAHTEWAKNCHYARRMRPALYNKTH